MKFYDAFSNVMHYSEQENIFFDDKVIHHLLKFFMTEKNEKDISDNMVQELNIELKKFSTEFKNGDILPNILIQIKDLNDKLEEKSRANIGKGEILESIRTGIKFTKEKEADLEDKYGNLIDVKYTERSKPANVHGQFFIGNEPIVKDNKRVMFKDKEYKTSEERKKLIHQITSCKLPEDVVIRFTHFDPKTNRYFWTDINSNIIEDHINNLLKLAKCYDFSEEYNKSEKIYNKINLTYSQWQHGHYRFTYKQFIEIINNNK